MRWFLSFFLRERDTEGSPSGRPCRLNVQVRVIEDETVSRRQACRLKTEMHPGKACRSCSLRIATISARRQHLRAMLVRGTWPSCRPGSTTLLPKLTMATFSLTRVHSDKQFRIVDSSP